MSDLKRKYKESDAHGKVFNASQSTVRARFSKGKGMGSLFVRRKNDSYSKQIKMSNQ